MYGMVYPENGTGQHHKRDGFRLILGNMGESKRIQVVVAHNVKKLKGLVQNDYPTIKAFAGYVGLGNGTIERILKGEQSCRVSSLEAIARRFGIEAWQLLVEGMEPQEGAELVKLFQQLDVADRAELLGYARGLARKKQPLTLVKKSGK